MNKREFIKTTSAASMFTLLNPVAALANESIDVNGKNVLVLGGRDFLGPTIVESFLEVGYQVTLLNRGKTNPNLFSKLPIIICDREKENKNGLREIDKKYKNIYWDIVVDTWQKSPKAVSDFLEEFKGRFGHYHYISTVAVYDKWDKKFIVESEPLNPIPQFPTTIRKEYRYAIRKTLAEVAIRERIDNYTIYRAQGIKSNRSVNPLDINEEPFWPIRFHRGGEILLPNVKDHHIQVTDAKSLSNFVVSCSQQNIYGEFNVAYDSTPFKDYVASLMYVNGRPEKLHWIDGEFLISHDLKPYKNVPLWKTKPAGAYYFNVQKAVNSGLVNRPIVDMITDQISGYKKRYPKNDIRFGKDSNGRIIKYSLNKEMEVIRKWQRFNN